MKERLTSEEGRGNYQSIEIEMVDSAPSAAAPPTAMAKGNLLLACTYLEDALKFRPQDIKRDADSQRVYRFFWSPAWRAVRYTAVGVHLCCGFFDMPWRTQPPVRLQVAGDLFCVAVFCIDAAMRAYFTGIGHLLSLKDSSMFPGLLACMCAIILDLSTRCVTEMQWSGCLRPFIIFYYSESSRISFMNTWRTVPSVLMVVLLELYVILVYACACFLLYGRHENDGEGPFRELDWSFINLFALSTTVNDPDIWLPLYAENPWNALVFISFLVTILYFIHNLVIATVYEVYTSSLSQHTQTRESNRSAALNSAFTLMARQTHAASKDTIMAVFGRMRPHYSEAKLQVLYELVDPEGMGEVPKDSFYLILDALNRRVRSRDPPAGGWRVCSNALLAMNACFVLGICVSGKISMEDISGDASVSVMIVFALLLFLDTAQQVMHTGVRHYLRSGWNRLAVISSAASAIALLVAANRDAKLDRASFLVGTLTLARCLDMVRLLGRVPQFNDIFESMTRVLPSIRGQVAVIFLLTHGAAWVGMLLWGGEISRDNDPWGGTEPYYWLLNFNTYIESVVTLFILVVVNNWNLISEGYFALGAHGGIGVYWYFIVFNVLVVTVALNIMTAFYITAYQITFSARTNDPEIRETSADGPANEEGHVRMKNFLATRSLSSDVHIHGRKFLVTERVVDEELLVREMTLDDVGVELFFRTFSKVKTFGISMHRAHEEVYKNSVFETLRTDFGITSFDDFQEGDQTQVLTHALDPSRRLAVEMIIAQERPRISLFLLRELQHL